MEIPSASSFQSPRLRGFLNKLTGRGWLYSGTWKKRYCILDGTKLYFYESEDSRGSERSAGVINLDYYDLCEEGGAKDSKRASNVFVIGTSVRGFFDNRHLFSADTPEQMENWVHEVRNAINDARNNRSRAGRSRPGDKKAPDGSSIEGSKNQGTEQKTFKDVPCSQSPDQLYHATKNRTRGPRGRRLPKRKTMMSELMLQDSEDLRPRSTSLSALERVMEEDDEENDRWLSVSMEAVDEPTTRSPYVSAENGFVETFHASTSSDNEFFTAKTSQKDHLLIPGQNTKQFETRRAALMSELESKWGGVGGDQKRPVSMWSSSSTAKPRQNQTVKDTHNSSMAALHNRIDRVECDVSATRKDMASVQDSLTSIKSSIRLLTHKVDSLEENFPFQNLEQQLTSRLTEMQAMCEEARTVLKEAQQARDEHMTLAKECQEVLDKFKIAGKPVVSPQDEDSAES